MIASISNKNFRMSHIQTRAKYFCIMLAYALFPKIAFASFERGLETVFALMLTIPLVLLFTSAISNILIIFFFLHKKDFLEKRFQIMVGIFYFIILVLLFFLTIKIFIDPNFLSSAFDQLKSSIFIIPVISIILYIIFPLLLYKNHYLSKKEITVYFKIMAIFIVLSTIILLSPDSHDGKG
jgi:hypothetical protein